MKRRYFSTAVALTGAGGVYAAEIKADSFASALRATIEGAEKRFRGQPYRITGIVEQVEIRERGPISLAFEVFAGRAGV